MKSDLTPSEKRDAVLFLAGALGGLAGSNAIRCSWIASAVWFVLTCVILSVADSMEKH